MLQYRTEVVIPPDRYVCLQLPDRFPLGNATVTIFFHERAEGAPSGDLEFDDDRQDIEWWEEFEDDRQQDG